MTTPIEKEKLPPSGSPAKIPSLPVPTPANAVDFAHKVKEYIDVREGRRGSSYEKVVTWRDLYEAGLFKFEPSSASGTTGQKGRLVLTAQQITGGTYQSLISRLEKDLRSTQLFKSLTTRIGDVEAMASYPDELRSLLNTSLATVARQRQADIQTVEYKMQSLERSVASKTEEITAAVEGAQAGVRHVDFTYATKTQALATSMTQVAARLDNAGGTGVTVEEQFLAQAGINTGLLGQWTVKVDVNGKVAGIGLAVDSPLEGTSTSNFIVTADSFGIFTSGGDVMPFGVDGTGAYINGSLRINAGGATMNKLGVTGYLTNEAMTVAADSSGTVSSFASAGGTFRIYQGDVNKTGDAAVTYSVVSPSGVTVNIATTGVYTVTGMSADTGTATLRAVYLGITIDKVYTISKSKAGSNGSPGSPGSAGTRGSMTVYVSGTYSSGAATSSSFASATGVSDKVLGDTVVFYSSTSGEDRRYRTANGGDTWVQATLFVHGNAVISGTLAASAITTGNLNATMYGWNGHVSVNTSSLSPTFKLTRTSSSLEGLYVTDSSTGSSYSLAYFSGTSGHFAVEAVQSSSSWSAGKFRNSGSSRAVSLAGNSYSVFSGSGEGKHYATDGLGPFTGFHDALIGAEAFETGDIVVDDVIVYAPDVNNALSTVMLSGQANQKGAIGIVSDSRELDQDVGLPYEMWWEFSHTHRLLSVNGVGEGKINVCGEGGTIEKGDLIVTSSTPGKGMKQADDIVRSYTVAKARETATFDTPEQVKQIACIYLCG